MRQHTKNALANHAQPGGREPTELEVVLGITAELTKLLGKENAETIVAFARLRVELVKAPFTDALKEALVEVRAGRHEALLFQARKPVAMIRFEGGIASAIREHTKEFTDTKWDDDELPRKLRLACGRALKWFAPTATDALITKLCAEFIVFAEKRIEMRVPEIAKALLAAGVPLPVTAPTVEATAREASASAT